MTEAIVVAIGAAGGGVLSTLITARRLRRDVRNVHKVVNSRFTAALRRIKALEEELRIVTGAQRPQRRKGDQ